MPLEISDLSLGDVQVNSKGAKQVPLHQGHNTLTWQPGPLRVKFQPAAFNDPSATRVSICFDVNEEVESYLKVLEDWVIKTVAASSRKYLGQDMTVAQVQERYSPAIKVNPKGYSHLRAKMNTSGRSAVTCWDENRMKREPPDDWTRVEVHPSFEIKGLWMMGKDFGLLIELTNAKITESPAICPF